MKIQREGCCNGLGVIATADINEGECVATVPITSVLACVNSDIRELVRENEGSLTSSWIPLLLTLAYEYSCKVFLSLSTLYAINFFCCLVLQQVVPLSIHCSQ